MTTTSGHRQRRLLLSLLMLLTLIGAFLAPAVDASASTRPVVETRVRANDHPTAALVGRVDPASPTTIGGSGVRLRQLVSATGVATIAARPSATSVIDDVMAETQAGAGNLTSKYSLTADEALTAGERWVGPGYAELGKPGSGVFRSADGTRQFRIDNGSITGAHSPGVPHVHLETISPGSKVPVANNHNTTPRSRGSASSFRSPNDGHG